MTLTRYRINVGMDGTAFMHPHSDGDYAEWIEAQQEIELLTAVLAEANEDRCDYPEHMDRQRNQRIENERLTAYLAAARAECELLQKEFTSQNLKLGNAEKECERLKRMVGDIDFICFDAEKDQDPIGDCSKDQVSIGIIHALVSRELSVKACATF